jgi:predicted AlkP superfamily pyrophosphatase or phosphodiesterase
VDTVISWLTDDDKPINLAFLYSNEPDSQGHSDGTEDEATLQVIRESDDRAGELVAKLKAAGIYDSVNLIFVSDHGMQTVSNETIINTTTMVNSSLYTNPGGSPVYQIWPEEGVSVEQLHEAFLNGSQTYDRNFRVYKKEEMGFVNFTSNRRISPLVLLAQPGYAFEDVERNLNGQGKYGVHGYDNRFSSMYAFFVARGPQFKTGYLSPSPIDNVDLVPLISEILGIPPPPNNGSLRHTEHFLRVDDGEPTSPENSESSPPTTPTPSPSKASFMTQSSLLLPLTFMTLVKLITHS